MNDATGQRNNRRRRSVVTRFAGEAFLHAQNPDDGPIARKLTSEITWKQPPSASVRAEVST